MHELDRHRVWAVNLDSARTRAEGRKLPKTLAVPSPTLTELTQAATQLGLNPEPAEASHPRTHRLRSGYIKISRQPHRLQTLKRIAQRIAENRAQARK